MIRKDFYLTEEQVTFLEDLENLSVSEHIRRAIDYYIERKTREKLNVSQSPSTMRYSWKGGNKHE